MVKSRCKAAREASKKIRIQVGQSGGSSKCRRRRSSSPTTPLLSEVLNMDTFSVLAIMDSSGEAVEEEVRVNDE
jgi:hypothetical protein